VPGDALQLQLHDGQVAARATLRDPHGVQVA